MAATMKDVALKAGVGIGTVSRVINGEPSVSDATKKSVLDAIKELNFTPNTMAARLRTNKNKLVALLVPVIDHPFFSKLAYFVEDELDKQGYSMMVVSSQRRKEKEEEVLSRLKRREVDGVIFVTHYNHDLMGLSGYPIVSIDRHVGEKTPYVTCDNYQATVNALEYLIGKGCKNIGYIGGKSTVESEVMLRVKAYKDVIKKHGLDEYISNEVIKHGEEHILIAEFFDRFKNLDGVFASGDVMAQGVYSKCKEIGVEIPQKLQLVSFDGAFMEWSTGERITCVEQPIEEMSRCVAKLVIDRINGKQVNLRNQFESKFIKGNTTV